MTDAMEEIYDPLKEKLIALIDMTRRISSITIFFFMSEIKSAIDRKKEQNSPEGKDKIAYGKDHGLKFLESLDEKLAPGINAFALEQEILINAYEITTKKAGILLPVKNFAVKI